MSLYKLFGFAILGLFSILLLRRLKEEYASLIAVFVGLALAASAFEILEPVVAYLRRLEAFAETQDLFARMFKASGIAVLCTLAGDICRDCGESALAGKVELCGKSVILVLCLPLLEGVFESVLALLG